MLATNQETVLRTGMAALRSRAPIFVPLLVLALLICHGALGSMDKLALDPASSVALHQLHSEAGGPSPADEPPVEHPPAHGYFIVTLLTVLAGTFLWLLFKGIVPTRRIFAAFGQAQYDLASNASYPRTSPTLALLQVFRL